MSEENSFSAGKTAENLYYKWRINTDPAYSNEMQVDMIQALNRAESYGFLQGEERAIRKCADIVDFQARASMIEAGHDEAEMVTTLRNKILGLLEKKK